MNYHTKRKSDKKGIKCGDNLYRIINEDSVDEYKDKVLQTMDKQERFDE